jgi:hypothetical protein
MTGSIRSSPLLTPWEYAIAVADTMTSFCDSGFAIVLNFIGLLRYDLEEGDSEKLSAIQHGTKILAGRLV